MQGKIALITGGGAGFGAEVARSLVREGAEVAILDLNEAGAKAVEREAGRRSV